MAFFLAVALPLPLFLVPGSAQGRAAVLALWLTWAWLCFGALAAACAGILRGSFRLAELRNWVGRHAVERSAALLLTALLLAWAGLALFFYLRLGLPLWVTVLLLALLGSLCLWACLALLASVGVAALEAASLKAAWKASALLPLAYGPALLGTALLAAALSGLPVLIFGLGHWSAPLLFAPLALSPIFTAAFFAAYLVILVRSLADAAVGGDGPMTPTWREIWSPWR
jgi:hypothetical protein